MLSPPVFHPFFFLQMMCIAVPAVLGQRNPLGQECETPTFHTHTQARIFSVFFSRSNICLVKAAYTSHSSVSFASTLRTFLTHLQRDNHKTMDVRGTVSEAHSASRQEGGLSLLVFVVLTYLPLQLAMSPKILAPKTRMKNHE